MSYITPSPTPQQRGSQGSDGNGQGKMGAGGVHGDLSSCWKLCRLAKLRIPDLEDEVNKKREHPIRPTIGTLGRWHPHRCPRSPYAYRGLGPSLQGPEAVWGSLRFDREELHFGVCWGAIRNYRRQFGDRDHQHRDWETRYEWIRVWELCLFRSTSELWLPNRVIAGVSSSVA